MNLSFRRHAVFYPSRRFFASNSIYKKATSFISYEILWMCVFQISCFFVSFEGSLKGLKLGLQHVSCYMLYGISHLCLFLFFLLFVLACFKTLNINGGTCMKVYLYILTGINSFELSAVNFTDISSTYRKYIFRKLFTDL